MKIVYVLIGLIFIFNGLLGIVMGSVGALGPLGVGGFVYSAENPFRFWLSISVNLFLGGVVIYRILSNK